MQKSNVPTKVVNNMLFAHMSIIIRGLLKKHGLGIASNYVMCFTLLLLSRTHLF